LKKLSSGKSGIINKTLLFVRELKFLLHVNVEPIIKLLVSFFIEIKSPQISEPGFSGLIGLARLFYQIYLNPANLVNPVNPGSNH